jgi:zinc-binding alcohol dehydrogenase/oxidoreductase
MPKTNTMNALVLDGVGEPLRMKIVPVPKIGKGEALVKIRAAAINRRDWWIQQGKYAGLKFPIILGSDGAGVVVAIADENQKEAEKQWLGKDVIINAAINWEKNSTVQPADFSILGLPEHGTFAEYVKVPIQNLFVKPTHLTFEEAAGLPIAGLTAYRALFTKARLQPNEKVLITGIGGGVATFALQWALHAGAEVYVTSSSDEKLKKAIGLGAKGGVNYLQDDWADQLMAMSGGMDVIIDSALGAGFAKFLEISNPGGRIVFFGGTAGDLPELNGRKIFWKQLQILGTTMGSGEEFEAMLHFTSIHQIRPVLDTVMPWFLAQHAVDSMNKSNQFGKIVIEMR